MFNEYHKLVVRLTPIGVFAIVSTAAGTLSLDELLRIQVYVVSLMAACVFLGLFTFPR